MTKDTVIRILALVLLLTFALVPAINADDFPAKEVTIVCHAKAGGGSDLFARQLAKYAEKYLGKPLIVINKRGGRGSTAMSYMHRLPPDGYTVMTCTPSVLSNWAAGRAPLAWDKFTGITIAQIDMWMIAVPAGSTYSSLEKLIREAKQNPDDLQWAGFEVGTSPHMIGYELSKAENFELTWIPYQGGGAVVTALLGNQQGVGIAAASVLRPHLDAKKLLPLAVASANRSVFYTDVPTLEEKGYDINLTQWRGIIARKGIPEERIQILSNAFQKAMQEPGWKDYMKKSGMEGINISPDEYSKSIYKEIKSIRTYMKQIDMIK